MKAIFLYFAHSMEHYQEIIHIKNMVCDRCIRVVKEELEKNGLQIIKITLGEAEIKSDSPINMNSVSATLAANGFELLENKNIRLVEQIKATIINLIHHKDLPLKENYSDFLSKSIGKDYHALSHLFSETENLTIEKYIIHQKIEKAKEMLVYNEHTLSEIAFKLGYSSVAYLSAQFKQVTGFTPSAFKKLKHHNRKPLDKV